MSHATDRRTVSLREDMYWHAVYAGELQGLNRTAWVRGAIEARLEAEQVPEPPADWKPQPARGGGRVRKIDPDAVPTYFPGLAGRS